MDGSLQLFGRAPMAAFNGDAAQNRKRKRKKGDSRGRRVLPLFITQLCFLLILFLEFSLSFAFSCMNLLQCNFLKASYCNGPNNAL